MQRQIFITKGPNSTLFRVDEDGQERCMHEDAYIDKSCCPAGTIGCCYGRDNIICPAEDCTGIQNYEVEELAERVRSGSENQYAC